MSETMQFLPKRDLLTLEELERLSIAFIERGVRKIRISGGEPLVRRDIMGFMERLSRWLQRGDLDELTLTTNATQLTRFARDLSDFGVKRINVSLDTLDDRKFEQLTRRPLLATVLRGIEAAQQAGLKVKINTVALKDFNRDEIPSIIEWAHGRDIDVTLIEIMPLGEVEEDRFNQYLPLTEVQDDLSRHWTLHQTDLNTGGPARYVKVEETGGILGFITPLTNNFCADCNRVRVTCTGQIYMCLGHMDCLDMRGALRSANPEQELAAILDRAMLRKPERHFFDISAPDSEPALARHMSVTGG